MPVLRGQNFQQVEMNIVGSSVFGRYPKIDIEKTYNMFISDNFLVPYAGYKIIVPSSLLSNGRKGRGIFASTKFDALIIVIDEFVYRVTLIYDQLTDGLIFEQIIPIGTLQSSQSIVYITENNYPQVLISDSQNLYIYDPTLSATVLVVPNLNFTPGYITFHNTFFICAASDDNTYSPPANNTWRLSLQNQGYLNTSDGSTAWPSTAAYVGLLQTKPDNTQAVLRFPSKGNMIFVMGSVVTESWFYTGAQLFPYQRTNQYNIDYGCLSPASVAYMDEVVVWLGANEKSGPIILASDGGMPRKITTDGLDFLFSELQNPQDCQGFLYRQDGHMFYHINFYSDNFSLFYDFNTDKFYYASDQNLNYFIASEVAYMNNQYYFVSRNTGNIYAFDTAFTTYQDVISNTDPTIVNHEIPRIRICKNVRLPSQDYFIVNDVGFTIESGATNPYQQDYTQPEDFLLLDGTNFLLLDGTNFKLLSNEEPIGIGLQSYTGPVVFFSASYDGGAVFGSEWAYQLPMIGYRRNRLMWWQIGLVNDFVPKFRFQSMGRVVATDGIVNIRY